MNPLEELRILADSTSAVRKEISSWLGEPTREERLEDQRRDARLLKQQHMEPVLYGPSDDGKAKKGAKKAEDSNGIPLPQHKQASVLQRKILGNKAANKVLFTQNQSNINDNSKEKKDKPTIFDRNGKPIKNKLKSVESNHNKLSKKEKKKLAKSVNQAVSHNTHIPNTNQDDSEDDEEYNLLKSIRSRS